jgi:hypothetical protein
LNYTLRTLALIFVLLVSASSAVTQEVKPAKEQRPAAADAEFNDKNWKTFSSAEGRFSASFPAPPSEGEQPLTSTLGVVTIHTFIARTNAEYGVSYADYLSPIEGTDLLVPFLDAVRDSGVQGVKGRLLDEHDISFEQHPGRAYRVEFGGGYVMNVRIFVVENRLYLITASSYGSKAPAGVARAYEGFATKFLDSFRLTSTIEDHKK